MAKAYLFQAVCTVALLAAGPALAQRPEAGMTNANGQPNPMVHQNAVAANTAPTDQTGSAPAPTHHSHYSAKGRSTHARSDMSQDAAVDRLNDQSYQAAQQGQSFSANGSSMSTAPSPASAMPSSAAPGAAPGGSSSGSK